MTVHTDIPATPAPGQGPPGIDRAATEAEAAHFGGTVVWWRTRCDNHEPSRVEEVGYGVRYEHPVTGQPGFLFWPGPGVRSAHSSMYVIDDGHTAVPHYVAGWSDQRGELILCPFPVNPDGQTRADRPDEVIDYGTWARGSARAYHVKITTDLD